MLRMLALSRHGNGALPNLLEIEIINAVAHLGREPLTLFGDRDAKPLDGRARHLAALFELVEDEQLDIELADRAGGLDGRAPTSDAMASALPALSKFERLAESHRVDEILAAATSATREARNGGEFLARVERDTGIRPRVISGVEEARLIHQAAVY